MSRTQADDLNYALRELDELTNPPAEWVAEGIRPVRGDVSAAASKLLRELIFRAELPLPQLAQVADGGVRIWWLGSGEQLTIEIGAEGFSATAFGEVDGRKTTVFHHDIQGDVIAVTADELDQTRALIEGLGGPSALLW
ncbi:hypothetical protein B5P44_00400 [Mycobacterium sp. CBMA 213]|uniref:Uncharacterized protein n=1 Tax=Mycolicibacterium sp. CBMA 213 TaxID=1968788 RepID=A0A343VR60_9MYCO|nr:MULTISPECIES: hypothetical protein [unclassified Mycolicibacterium]AVN58384.1 hypothetical protein B5P44_p00089 [Mycolicibacterium sp. CBMA 213]MUL61046.1 hypothetical protein [Mycolicibacterium sp. CBMA 335]MUM03283.1 hypothetical protein [Mycolicibacterium sp. CBMA 213]